MITALIVIAMAPAVVMACVVTLLRAWLRREDTGHSIKAAPSTRTSAVSRRIVGLYVRTPAADAEDRQPDGLVGIAGRRPSDPAWPGNAAG